MTVISIELDSQQNSLDGQKFYLLSRVGLGSIDVERNELNADSGRCSLMSLKLYSKNFFADPQLG